MPDAAPDPEIEADTVTEPAAAAVPTRQALENARTATLCCHQEAVKQAYAGRYENRHGLAEAVEAADRALNAELARIAALSLSIGR
jgi:hypothetical protein